MGRGTGGGQGSPRGIGTVGRNPGVRPVLEPVEARRSAGAIGERSRSGPGAEGGGEAILVVAWAEVPVVGFGEAVVDEVLETCYGRVVEKQGARKHEEGPHER